MKISYHVSCHYENNALVQLLESENIKIDDCISRSFVFDFDSNHAKCKEILDLIAQDPLPLLLKEAVFSKKELASANWLSFEATRQSVDNRDDDFTYDFLDNRPHTRFEVQRGHCRQIRPFIVKSVPKWKNKFNFASSADGDFTKIFCSDVAKQALSDSGLKGVEFMEVLKGDRVTPKENIHQLVVPNLLPNDSIEVIGPHDVEYCPICGKEKYLLREPMMENYRVDPEKIPEGVDIFETEFGYMRGEIKVWVVSQKFYKFITETMQERGARFYPLG